MVNSDFVIACDRSEAPTTRRAAWERYEVDCWYRAYKERGLLIKNMDTDRVGLDGESMQFLVCRRMKLPTMNKPREL